MAAFFSCYSFYSFRACLSVCQSAYAFIGRSVCLPVASTFSVSASYIISFYVTYFCFRDCLVFTLIAVDLLRLHIIFWSNFLIYFSHLLSFSYPFSYLFLIYCPSFSYPTPLPLRCSSSSFAPLFLSISPPLLPLLFPLSFSSILSSLLFPLHFPPPLFPLSPHYFPPHLLHLFSRIPLPICSFSPSLHPILFLPPHPPVLRGPGQD